MGDDEKQGHDRKDGRHDGEILRPRGDYQTLLSYQKPEVVYDLTFRFAHKYLSKGDRTVDQMIQSARSGKQNIAEGSKAALTSKETEISSRMSPARVSRSCSSTIAITFESETMSYGTRIRRSRISCGS